MRTRVELLSCLQKFIADAGKPRCFRMDYDGGNTSRRFVTTVSVTNKVSGVSTPRLTLGSKTPYPVETLLWRVLKGGHSTRLGILPRILPSLDLEKIEHLEKDFQRLWMEAVVWAC